jgi:tape measure domain-containing protein
MADQEVRYIVYIDGTERAQLALRGMETSADRAERSIGNLNDALRTTASIGGIGFGVHGLKRMAEDWVQAAADIETSNKRIVFASENMRDGAKNLAFIGKEVDALKIPLKEATADFGKFLAMMQGAEIPTDKIRELHDEILTISKIKSLDAGQLSAGVMNLGKMLEAGAMDARHLKPLEMQLSGIGQFIAKEMGTDVHGLAKMRGAGQLTNVDPLVLLKAVKKQADSLRQFLPEATQTLQSDLNDLGNAWLRFKTSVVFDNSAELKEFFGTLKDGVKYLSDHRADLERVGGVLIRLGKTYVEYKLVSGALGLMFKGFQNMQTAAAAFVGQSTRTVTAAEAQALAFNSLAVSMERLVYVQATLANMPTLASMSAANAAAYGAVSTTAGAGKGAGWLSTIKDGAMKVVVTFFAAEALSQLGVNRTEDGYKFSKWDYIKAVTSPNQFNEISTLATVQDAINATTGNYTGRGDQQNVLANIESYFTEHKVAGRVKDAFRSMIPLDERGERNLSDSSLISIFGAKGVRFKEQEAHLRNLRDIQARAAAKNPNAPKTPPGDGGKIIPPTDKVTGQRVINYYITVKEVNGIKQNTVQEGGKFDERRVGELLRDEIMSILHDTQLRTGN